MTSHAIVPDLRGSTVLPNLLPLQAKDMEEVRLSLPQLVIKIGKNEGIRR